MATYQNANLLCPKDGGMRLGDAARRQAKPGGQTWPRITNPATPLLAASAPTRGPT